MPIINTCKVYFLFTILTLLSACNNSSNSDEEGVTITQNPAAVKKTRPNIVVVLTDDMRWDLMSLLNHPFVNTPNMDRLANDGLLFNKAFIPVPICSPSRAGLLTGRDPHRASAPDIVWRNNSFLETQTIFPELLHDSGYRTGYFGKWHLGDGKVPKAGFDQWESFDWLGDFNDLTLWINGKKKNFPGLFSDDVISNRAAEFIKRESGKETPFFAMVGLKQPHMPFTSPKRHENQFADETIPKPTTFDEDFSVTGKLYSPFLNFEDGPAGKKFFGSWDNYIKKHYRAILGLDDAVGTIIKALEDSGELDNTFFIYTSDNGYSLGDHGHTEKHLTYEEPIRVPMLVRYPKAVKAGTFVDQMVSNIDIAPTILDYAGVEVPDGMTGLSWRPLFEYSQNLDQAAPSWRSQLFFWFRQAAVRTDRYKLIQEINRPEHFELYDLDTDPKEVNNLYGHPEHEDLQKTMLDLFEEETKKIGWTKRENSKIKSLYISQALSHTEAVNAVKQLSSQSVQSLTPETLNNKIQWEKVSAVNDKFKIEYNVAQNLKKPSVLITIPVERLTAWDPFIALTLKNKTIRASLFSQGKKVWDNREHKAQLNTANSPLHYSVDNIYMLLEFPATNIVTTQLDINAPVGSIILPLK